MKRLTKTIDRFVLQSIPFSYSISLQHKRARKNFHRYMKQRMGHFIVEVDPGPIGDEEIILRTAVLREEEASKKLNADYYFWSGYTTMLAWLRHLEKHAFNLRTASAIMEPGCGSARLIRHLRCIDGIRLVGTDIKSEFISWCQCNVPDIEFYVNDLIPPLSFAENDSFDMVFAESVFTHIPLENQGLWIEELNRVLRPGGYLVATVLGRHHQSRMLSTDDQVQLLKQGHLTLDAHDNNASLSTQLIGSWDVFQTRREVIEAFSACFEICDYIPRPLDVLVLRKSGGNNQSSHFNGRIGPAG